MSADNWAICPKCIRVEEVIRERAKAEANNSYGKIPPYQWKAIVDKAESPISLGKTLREDYQVGIDECGDFVVEYSGSCDKCGWSFQHNHSEQAFDG